jgi:hypothetical protein
MRLYIPEMRTGFAYHVTRTFQSTSVKGKAQWSDFHKSIHHECM